MDDDRDAKLGRWVRDAIGKAMNQTAAVYLEIPLPVDGHHELMVRAKLDIPRAVKWVTVFNEDGSFKRVARHGTWSVEKQCIVWDEPHEMYADHEIPG